MMNKEEIMDDVDTSRIEEGQIVKNYRQLCDLLGEERTTGNAKKAQMANWERFFSITKIKGTQKMRIDEIYIEPLERVDGRAKGGRSIYVQSVEVVLLNYLSHQKGYSATFTKNKLYTRLNALFFCNRTPKRHNKTRNTIKEQMFDNKSGYKT